MKVLVRGKDSQIKEFKLKFPEQGEVVFDQANESIPAIGSFDLVFDFFLDESPENLDQYAMEEDLVVFCNSVKSSLAEFSFYLDHAFTFKMLGFNGLPTFFNRELMEVSTLNDGDRELVRSFCSKLDTDFVLVEDRVGMVSPRVICMIINEAYYTVQEGTADKEGIDLAMKLGTNYPMGPFEWTERMGINTVYELLESVYEDTKDERYKICPLLKREYLLTQ